MSSVECDPTGAAHAKADATVTEAKAMHASVPFERISSPLTDRNITSPRADGIRVGPLLIAGGRIRFGNGRHDVGAKDEHGFFAAFVGPASGARRNGRSFSMVCQGIAIESQTSRGLLSERQGRRLCGSRSPRGSPTPERPALCSFGRVFLGTACAAHCGARLPKSRRRHPCCKLCCEACRLAAPVCSARPAPLHLPLVSSADSAAMVPLG